MAPPFPRDVKKITLGRGAVDSNFAPRVSGAFFCCPLESAIICTMSPSTHTTTYPLFRDAEWQPSLFALLTTAGAALAFNSGLAESSMNLQISRLPFSVDLTPYYKQDAPDKQPGIPSHKNLHLEQHSSTAIGVVTTAPYNK